MLFLPVFDFYFFIHFFDWPQFAPVWGRTCRDAIFTCGFSGLFTDTSHHIRFYFSLFLPPLFTARCYASAVLAMGLCLPVCVCVCVCLSLTSRRSTKTAKRRITQTTPHDTLGTLLLRRQRSPRNSTGVTLYGGAKCRCGWQNRWLSTNNRLYLKNGAR